MLWIGRGKDVLCLVNVAFFLGCLILWPYDCLSSLVFETFWECESKHETTGLLRIVGDG